MIALILIVDDDAAQRTMLRDFFEFKKCRVIEAQDGTQGVMMAEAHRPHIIIMDAMMPSMYGTSATKKLQEIAGTSRIPIIMRSSYDENALRKNLPETDKVKFVAKEKPLTDLWDRITAMLPEGGYTAQ